MVDGEVSIKSFCNLIKGLIVLPNFENGLDGTKLFEPNGQNQSTEYKLSFFTKTLNYPKETETRFIFRFLQNSLKVFQNAIESIRSKNLEVMQCTRVSIKTGKLLLYITKWFLVSGEIFK